MKLVIPALAAAVIAACAPVAADDTPVRGVGTCDATSVQSLVGQLRTPQLGADALKRSTARSLRWIAPGTMVTMDYREDRLNIHLDAKNRVTSIKCG